MQFSTVCVLGLGYIGLPTASIIASRGVDVVGVDTNEAVLRTLWAGDVHITEPDIEAIVSKVIASERLTLQSDVVTSDVFLIAVPTPFKSDHEPDLAYIYQAAESISKVLKPGNLVVLESTSPVGTTQILSEYLSEKRPDLSFPHSNTNPDISIAYCPERVLPGRVLQELVENDRVIGGLSSQCAEKAKAFYEIFVKGECILTDAKTAEMVKLSENAYRDVNIAFANELSIICDNKQINVWELIKLTNRHPRVEILKPGPGVGGHCIAVDPWFIIHEEKENAKLIKLARTINEEKEKYVIDQINQKITSISNPTVAFLGITYKADTNDIRESPALKIVLTISKQKNANVLFVEPNIRDLPSSLVSESNVRHVQLDDAVTEADIIVLLVGHQEFKSINVRRLKNKQVIDHQGIWS